MDREQICHIANVAFHQILSTVGNNVVLSWGLKNISAVYFESMPALVMKVSARLFKGDVIVALNDWDYYEIYLQDKKGVRKIGDELCCDTIGDVIDREIERGDDEAEYRAFCENFVRNAI